MAEKFRSKLEPSGASADREAGRCVRSDLERLGVPTRFSQTVADRLGAIAEDLDSHEYRAVLDGVAAACSAPDESPDLAPEAADLAELRRLVDGFSDELRKLEEGLKILSTYVVRMTARAAGATPPTLH